MSFEYENLENLNIQLIDGDRGKNYPKQSEFQESGYCLFLSAKNVTKLGFQFSEKVYVSEERHSLLRAGKLERYDIVLTTRGTIGNVAFYDDSVLDDVVRVNSGMLILRADTSVWNPRFLYFLFTSKIIQGQISSLTSGSAVPQLPAKDLRKFLLPKVPMRVQNNIVKIIGVLTDKLNINDQTNQTLEEMAQTIFKSWFVDFDPVKAKMNGEQPEGMDEATASLFPDKLVESELGLIPEGWGINTIKDFGKVVTGKTPPKIVEDAYAAQGVPFVTPSDIDSDVFVSETKRSLSKSGVDVVKKHLLPEGSICVTCIGSQMGKAVISPSLAISNQQINSVVVAKNYERNFLFLNLRGRREEIFLIGSSGSTMPIINKSTFEKLAVLTPPEDLMHSFDQAVASLLCKIRRNAIENQTLSPLRDVLLLKLLSGEVELEEAEGE